VIKRVVNISVNKIWDQDAVNNFFCNDPDRLPVIMCGVADCVIHIGICALLDAVLVCDAEFR